MIAQADKTVNKPLNDRQERFCQLMTKGDLTATEAFRRAGYSHSGANAHSADLVAKRSIKHRIANLRAELAIKHGITQEIQATKLEDLRIRCKFNEDSTGENAAIREQNKLYGLSIDKQQTETTDAQRALDVKDAALADKLAKQLLDEELAGVTAQGL